MRFKTNDQRGQPDKTAHYLARGLGVFSIVLGLGELAFGGPLSRALGLDGYAWLIRVYGGREIITGIFVLACKDPTGWIWFRVAGDVLDIGTVFFGYTRNPGKLVGIIVALVALVGATIADIYCALRLSRDSTEPLPPVRDLSRRTG